MLNQDQAVEAWGRIKDFITNREGEIVNERSWGTRRLAYPIRKGSYNFLEGSYYLTQFSTEKPFNRELETFLRLDDRVLRSLVVATGAPSPVAVVEPAPVATPATAEVEAESATAEAPVSEVAMAEAVEEAGPTAAEEPTEAAEAPDQEAAPVAVEEPVEAPEEEPLAEAAAEDRPDSQTEEERP
jgi:small subunit ribosomal protein S6